MALERKMTGVNYINGSFNAKKRGKNNQTICSANNAHNVKNLELLKHFRVKEAAPTCFGLQGNHHQGATAST